MEEGQRRRARHPPRAPNMAAPSGPRPLRAPAASRDRLSQWPPEDRRRKPIRRESGRAVCRAGAKAAGKCSFWLWVSGCEGIGGQNGENNGLR